LRTDGRALEVEEVRPGNSHLACECRGQDDGDKRFHDASPCAVRSFFPGFRSTAGPDERLGGRLGPVLNFPGDFLGDFCRVFLRLALNQIRLLARLRRLPHRGKAWATASTHMTPLTAPPPPGRSAATPALLRVTQHRPDAGRP